MRDGIRGMIADLETVRENLLAYGDDMWLNIDRRDPARREHGVHYVLEYDAKVEAFSALASECSA